MSDDQAVTELHALQEPPAPVLRVRVIALPAAVCRACRTIHRPADPCGPSTTRQVAA